MSLERMVDLVRSGLKAGRVSLPRAEVHLKAFVRDSFGVSFPERAVCPGHVSPWQVFADAYFARAPLIVFHGSRLFSGKSYLQAALAVTEAVTLGVDVTVLGGSGAQSRRVLDYIHQLLRHPGAPSELLIGEPASFKVKLATGNKIEALLASRRSVRGSHPTRLHLDECLAGGTRIATPKGWRDIARLSPGDTVYSWHEGRVVVGRVTTRWFRGWRRTVNVGGRFYATPEHPVLSRDGWIYAGCAQAAHIQSVCEMRCSNQEGSPTRRQARRSRRGLSCLLSLKRQSRSRQDLSSVWGTENGGCGRLHGLLFHAPSKAPGSVPGLQAGVDVVRHHAVQALPSQVDEWSRRRAICSKSIDCTEDAREDEQGRTTGAGAARSLRYSVSTTSPDRSMDCRFSGRRRIAASRDRGARRVLARSSSPPDAGCQESRGTHAVGVSAGRASHRRDTLLVEDDGFVRIGHVSPGPIAPVYDIATTTGSFIAEGLVVHNCDEMPLEIFNDAMGLTFARGGHAAQTLVSSTHHHPDGTFTEILRRAKDQGWPVHQVCWRESLAPHGWLHEGEVERKRAEMSATQFATEVDLSEPSPEGRAILPELVEWAFQGNGQDWAGHDGEEVIAEPPQPGATYAHGADWAKTKDWTSIVTIRTDVRPWRVVAFVRLQRRPIPAMAALLDARIDRYGGVAAHDETSLGGQAFADLLQHDVWGFVFVGRQRRDLFTDYVTTIENRGLVWPRIEAAYTAHKFTTSDDLYGAGHPPDELAAAALAVWAGDRQATRPSTRMASPGIDRVSPLAPVWT